LLFIGGGEMENVLQIIEKGIGTQGVAGECRILYLCKEMLMRAMQSKSATYAK